MPKYYTLAFGNCNLSIRTDAPLDVEEHFLRFEEKDGKNADVFEIIETDNMPDLPQCILGEDLLLRYYASGEFRYAVARPGTSGLIVVTVYREDFSKATMYIRKSRLPGMIHSIGKALQLFPMRAFLTYHRAMLLHASEVCYAGHGILFTAPSGTGKTTQARLWRDTLGAAIICNDRTLLFQKEDKVLTSGFPVDGSSPIYSTCQQELGAIIVLSQSSSCTVSRLRPFHALKYLMEQTVSDVWDPVQREKQLSLWMKIVEKYPVYALSCTPDVSAVQCLQQKLLEDKVI